MSNSVIHSSPNEVAAAENALDNSSLKGGFIRYYGLYWDKEKVFWNEEQLLAVPIGKTGKGKPPKNAADNWNCVNFWGQKGVYILYDKEMYPVYAGQVGVEKNNKVGMSDIGARLNTHRQGKYRNAWHYFSWFGFLERRKFQTTVRELELERQISPEWSFPNIQRPNLNVLLASFEAIIIEGFIPRLNSRGGDLKDAVLCDQYEGQISLRHV